MLEELYLRDYQVDAKNKIEEHIIKNDTKLHLAMAVGTGKTALAMAIAKEELINKRKILYLSQTRITGTYFKETINQYSFSEKTNVICDASNLEVMLYKGINGKGFELLKYHIVICDEIDMCEDETIRFLSNLDTVVIGFSSRLKSIDGFKTIYDYGIKSAVIDGYYRENLIINSYIQEHLKDKLEELRTKATFNNSDVEYINDFNDYIINKSEDLTYQEKEIADLREYDLNLEEVKALSDKKMALKEFENLLKSSENISENTWQRFFEKNKWIIGYGSNCVFSEKVATEKLESYISMPGVFSNRKRLDALMKSRGLINSLCFVEIKTSDTKLLRAKYRDECWPISSDLSGAIAQVQNYKNNLEAEISKKIQLLDDRGKNIGKPIYNYNPKAVLVIGSLSEFIEDDFILEGMYASFEIFRKSVLGIDIITFDELLTRAQSIVDSKES